MTDRLAHLNPAQRDAVLTLAGPLLVLAGAGTGKTRVITHRMAELIRSGVPADRILSVTFTNKAAKEMLERTQELLGGRGRMKARPLISTFHSYCVRVLRQEIEALGYPKSFTIYDRGDQETAARKALRDVKIPDTSLAPGDLLSVISRWKMQGVDPRRSGTVCENDKEVLASSAYRRYQNNLRACGALDFDDLLLLTSQLFQDVPEALARQQARFEHVQIDEYQDTNGIQFELIDQLVEPHKNLCVVGDDDQSIYGWRGAEVTHILGFQQHFPGAKVIRLEDNYRCTARILELANRLVKKNRDRHDKTLRACRELGSTVRFREFEDEQVEAENVVREIAFMIEKKGVPPQDVCILFRTNEQPRVFEAELRRQRVRYVIMGSQSFFDKAEIRDVLAYLKLLDNPRDENALLRIINVPARGIGEASVETLLKRAVRTGCSLFDAVPAALAEKEISPRAAGAIHRFQELLHRYRARLQAQPRELPGITQELLAEIDYASEIQKQYDNEDMQLIRTEMVEQMVDSLRIYVERCEGEPSLGGYLDEAMLTGREEGSDKEQKLAESAVRLMTVHSAKGLEFKRVYLVGMEEGLLPHKRSIEINTEAAIAEERRLAYVAITRAQDHLMLTWAAARKKWGKKRLSVPSRFLYEMLGDQVPRGASQ